MKLFEFEKYFLTEEICRAKFKEMRDKEDIVCSKCGCVHHLLGYPQKGNTDAKSVITAPH
ncbi:hypothetical protein EZS27_024105 [termite gut metagenome]|uniref:Transposase zinc-ribbon domain-containing protein n=1 Tax=termite gut metagenome TaxID=433724 RepID=A0A5J4QY17_9ZZZZ